MPEPNVLVLQVAINLPDCAHITEDGNLIAGRTDLIDVVRNALNSQPYIYDKAALQWAEVHFANGPTAEVAV